MRKTKTCIDCAQTMPLSSFYRNLTYTDGHTGRCKECAKAWSRGWYQRKCATDLEWLLQRRESGRKATAKWSAGKKVSVSVMRLHTLKFRSKYPERYVANTAVSNALRDGRLIRKPCEVCGKRAQAHHDDYSKPLDVRWLCVKHHNDAHNEMRARALIKERQQQLKSKGLD